MQLRPMVRQASIMANPNSLRGKVAIIGIGASGFYRYGKSPDPEFKLVLQAVLAACQDAGLDPKEVDGWASFSGDRNDPARLAAALGTHRLRSSVMHTGGGGGNCAAVADGAAAILAGLAENVIVYRGLAQGQFGRFGQAHDRPTVSGDDAFMAPYGVFSPAQKFAMRVTRFMHDHGIARDALRAIAMASYHHAQANPRAVMHGRPLSAQAYDASRWIVEPFRLYDCCMENDGAAAVLLVSAHRAMDFAQKPAYILGAASGGGCRAAAQPHNAPEYASAGFRGVAADLWGMAGMSPADVGVVQSYENFTGGVLMSLIEHGFFLPEEANDFLTVENLIAATGKLPLNTSGGNLAECYVHGMGQVLEAVRQIRGTSTAQVPKNDAALVIGGPMVTPVSNLLLGSEKTL